MSHEAESWSDPYHELGLALQHQGLGILYVNVPKCASTWAKSILQELGFTWTNWKQFPQQFRHIIGIVRDPIERFISSAPFLDFDLKKQKALLLHMPARDFELQVGQLLKEHHSRPQHMFYHDLDIANARFFWCESNLQLNLAAWLHGMGLDVTCVDWTSKNTKSEQTLQRQQCADMWTWALQELPERRKSLEKLHQSDYDWLQQLSAQEKLPVR